MKIKKDRGFTLIELLVVIAIIGILSAVVLTSLTTAGDKGADAAIKSNLDTIRSQAAIYYFNNNNRFATPTTFTAGLCSTTPAGNLFADPVIQAAIKEANLRAGGTQAATYSLARCSTSAKTFAVVVSLNGGGGWCVDSTNVAKRTVAAATAAGSISPATTLGLCGP